jgi:plastocyanin
MPRTAAIAVALSALLAISTTACGGSSDGASSKDTTATTATATSTAGDATASKDVDVEIANYAFSPDEVEVEAGGTVTFTNSDDTTHTATAESDAPASFDTGELGQGDSKTITFDEPGVYDYECSIHEYMKGTVRVIG